MDRAILKIMSRGSVSAILPCRNSSLTLSRALSSVQKQTIPVGEIIVIDDASTDDSPAIAEEHGARVVRLPCRLGRGGVRARGMVEAAGEFTLWCDSTNILSRNFLEGAIVWMKEERVAAVTGTIRSERTHGPVGRWRERHLFRYDPKAEFCVRRDSPLLTGGCLLRREAVMEVGNFDASLEQGEDLDLGRRLVAAQWGVLKDTRVVATSIVENTLFQVMERYWRWNSPGKPSAFHLMEYAKAVWFAARVMAAKDLQAGDPGAALISLFSPHYCQWMNLRK